MVNKPLVLRFAVAAFGVAASNIAGAQGAKAPCSLLKIAEVQSLNPGAQVREGVPGSVPPLGSVTCEYKWEGGKGAPVDYRLQVIVTEASKMFPGMDAKTIKLGMLGGPRGLPPGTSAVPGVGEAATYTSASPVKTSTSAYVKGLMLQLEFEGPDAPAKKEQAIALLKAAAARLYIRQHDNGSGAARHFIGQLVRAATEIENSQDSSPSQSPERST